MSKIIEILRLLEKLRKQPAEDIGSTSKQSPGENFAQLDFESFDHSQAGPSTPDNIYDPEPASKRGVMIMKNQWVLWFLIIAVIGIVLFAFNYQGGKDAVPLSEIFPSQDVAQDADVEYVFMDEPTIPMEEPAESPETRPEAETIEVVETVVANPPLARTPASSPPDLSGAQYTIQVASFQKKEYAQKVIDELKQKGHPAFLIDKDLGAKGVWYRVYVGKFQSSDDASQYISRLPQNYKEGFVLKL